MPRFELVLFDLDGTLFDHQGAAQAGVTAFLQRMEVEPTAELINHWFDAESRYISAWHAGEIDWGEQRRARLREILPLIGQPVRDATGLDLLFADYLSVYEQSWRAFPDVDPALEALQTAGVEVAVLTNGADHQQRQKIAAIGLTGRVGRMFSSDTIGFSKPDVRAYQHACSELHLSPSAVLHVGDRFDLDVVAARAAGLQAVHLDRTGNGRADQHRVTSLTELKNRL